MTPQVAGTPFTVAGVGVGSAATVTARDLHEAAASRLQTRAGYGLPVGAGRFIGTPQLGFGPSEGNHDYTLGWRLIEAQREEINLRLGAEASRQRSQMPATRSTG